MSEVKKCPKCGSADVHEKHVRLAGSAGMFNPLETTARIYHRCGYVELYERR